MWRWDQGRLLYFQFDVLKSIATVLVKFDGVNIAACEDIFRKALTDATGMPFAPAHYTVLRNYKRIFECAFLATVFERRLIVSDFCRELAKPDGEFSNVDDYLLSYINRFRFPFPAFDGYDATTEREYPFCAVLKYLIALSQNGASPCVSVDEVFSAVIDNNCSGYEDLSFYSRLTPKQFDYTEAEKRQVREMMIL